MGRSGAPTRRGRTAKGAKAQSTEDTTKVLDTTKVPDAGKSSRGTRASKTSSTDTAQDGKRAISATPTNPPSRTMPMRSRRKPSRYSTQETRKERDHHENEGRSLNDGMELLDLFRNTLRKVTEETTDEGRTDAAIHGREIMKEALMGHKVEERDWASFEVLSTMSEALDLDTQPSLEYTLGVLGVTELPESLQERARAQGARAYNEVFRNFQIRRRKQEREKQKKEVMKGKKGKEKKQKQKAEKSKARKGFQEKERNESSGVGREGPEKEIDKMPEHDQKQMDLEKNIANEGKTEPVKGKSSGRTEGAAGSPMETNIERKTQDKTLEVPRNTTQDTVTLHESKSPEQQDDIMVDTLPNAATDEEMKDVNVSGNEMKRHAENSDGPESLEKATEKDQERARGSENTSKKKEQAIPHSHQLRRSSRRGPVEKSDQDNDTPTGKDDKNALKAMKQQPEPSSGSNMDLDVRSRQEGDMSTNSAQKIVSEAEKERIGGMKGPKERLTSSTPEDSSQKTAEKPRKFTRMATKRRGRTKIGTQPPQEKESSEHRSSIATELANPKAEQISEEHVDRGEDRSQKLKVETAATCQPTDVMTDSESKVKEASTTPTENITKVAKKDIHNPGEAIARKSTTETESAATSKKEKEDKTSLPSSIQPEPSEHVESLSIRKQEKEDVDMLKPHEAKDVDTELRRTHNGRESPLSLKEEGDAETPGVESSSRKHLREEDPGQSRTAMSGKYPTKSGKEQTGEKNVQMEETETEVSAATGTAKKVDIAPDGKALRTVVKGRTDADAVKREEKPASRPTETQRPETDEGTTKDEKGKPQGLFKEQKRALTAEELEKETMAAVFGASDDEDDMHGNVIDLKPSGGGENHGPKDEENQKKSPRKDAERERQQDSLKEAEDEKSEEVDFRGMRGRSKGRGRRRVQKETKGQQKAIEKTERRMSSRRYSGTRDDLVIAQSRHTRLRRESTNLNDGRFMLRTENEYMLACAAVWQSVHDEKISIPFRQPVQKKDAPDYFDVVKKPMDLATVRKNMESEVIKSPIEFYESMMQIVKNAFLYNAKNSDLWGLAAELQLIIRDKTRPIVTKWCDSTGESYEFSEDEDIGQEGNSESAEDLEVVGTPKAKTKRLGRPPKHKKSEDIVEIAPPSKRGRGRGRGRARGRRGTGINRTTVGRKRAPEVEADVTKSKKRRVGRPRKDGS